MTNSLEHVLSEVAKLPPGEQDILANLLMDEIKSEQKWMHLVEKSENFLESLANEALAEFAAGKTKPLQDLL